jgi:hypothetical protein
MAYFLPFRPYVPADLRVFGIQRLLEGSPSLNRLSGYSTPPQRLSLLLAALAPVLGRPEARSKAPRLSLLALQHLKYRDPSFHSFRSVQGALPRSPESPTPRVWLPSRWCQPAILLEASFSSLHSWASPFRAFLSPRNRLSLSKKTSALALP